VTGEERGKFKREKEKADLELQSLEGTDKNESLEGQYTHLHGIKPREDHVGDGWQGNLAQDFSVHIYHELGLSWGDSPDPQAKAHNLDVSLLPSLEGASVGVAEIREGNATNAVLVPARGTFRSCWDSYCRLKPVQSVKKVKAIEVVGGGGARCYYMEGCCSSEINESGKNRGDKPVTTYALTFKNVSLLMRRKSGDSAGTSTNRGKWGRL
jgi:hypothetical protein